MNWPLVNSLVVTFIFGLMMTLTSSMPVDEYTAARNKMLRMDRSTQLGSNLTLNKKELTVSDAMVKEKAKMMEESRLKGTDYFPSLSFYKSKPLMEKTPLFKLIQQMPKGGALHLHDQAVTSLDWVVKNATYRDHLWMCINQKTHLMQFMFSKETPKALPDCCNWNLVKDLRNAATNVYKFDESIKRNLSMLSTDPLITYPTITAAWTRFMLYFGQVFNIIFYEPVFRDYFYQALKEFSEDGVQYMELRSLMAGIYDLKGNVYPREKAFQLYMQVTENFKKCHGDFIGAKFIMSGIRVSRPDVILQEIKDTMGMREKYPDSMAGYDLVGQEDPNKSLLYYRDELLYPTQVDQNNPLPYFFHAAETNWQGTEVDYNLIDALLLNTSRIGHGFGLIKHPTLMQVVKDRQIGIEVNPISNQILGLVTDLRNHAMTPLLADNFPIVISSDDPATWEATPLSNDFFLAFMNMCGEDADLRFLKQLAINSIQFSAMNADEKALAMKKWEMKWNEFINNAAEMIEHGNLQG